MSGRGAPARTATATPERTRSTRLPATMRPLSAICSMALLTPARRCRTASPACHAPGGIDTADGFDLYLQR
jgi:hypothetical protein